MAKSASAGSGVWRYRNGVAAETGASNGSGIWRQRQPKKQLAYHGEMA